MHVKRRKGIDYFKQINISTKLGIFLLLPVIALLFFAYNTTTEKYRQLQSIEDSLHFSDFTRPFIDIAHQLQKERGISVGVVMRRDQTDLKSLVLQRQQTDALIKQLSPHLSNVPGYLAKSEARKLDQLNLKLSELTIIRSEVDQLNSEHFFDSYSQLIDAIMDVISIIQVLSTDNEYQNLALSYFHILSLKEYAGRERGILYGVFTAQQLDSKKFNAITNYIAGQHTELRYFNNIATSKHQAYLNNIQSHSATKTIEHFRKTIYQKGTRNDALNSLQFLVGYGGLIHDFKNFVIRGNQQYFKRFKLKYEDFLDEIKTYKNLPEINTQEKEALDIIQNTFRQYNSYLSKIDEMKVEQLEVNDIDDIVIVNDNPALDAISYLQHNLIRQNPSFWWQASTERINQIHEASILIASDMTVLGEQMKSDTRNLLHLYLAFTLTTIIFTIFIGLRLRSRLVHEIRYIADALRSSKKKHQFNQLLVVSGDDEISDMASAFNNLMIERSAAEKQLQLASQVFRETNEGISITDKDGLIIDVNPAFCELTGYNLKEIVGKKHNILSSGKQSPEFYTKMWGTLKSHGYWKGEIWNRRKNGELYAELLTISTLKGDDGRITNYVGFFTDITQSKQYQKDLELMAHYDVLTKLPNRILFAARFVHATARCKRSNSSLAICFLDLDNFKPVNDYHGHGIGDKLLVEVAKRIKDTIREEDTAARLGGDEFAILLGDVDSEISCMKLLERIIESLSRPYYIDKITINISTSIGATIYPLDYADIDTLLRHADQAMYQAKLSGKNAFHFYNAEKDQQTTRRHAQLQEIKAALLNNEFRLYYQPKIDMRTGEVFGAEALIRWEKSGEGIIPPLSFLPLLANTELEILVGQWVIHETLKQLNEWVSQGLHLEVSLNVSSHHLQAPSFLTHLRETLDKFPSIDSRCLQLEILESSTLGDIHSIRNIVESCQNLGVRIALDDFGTGYSSLTHLREIPCDIIKIDQNFVRDILDDPDDYSIIDGIIGLADSFNRQIIAEGVETKEHGMMLQLMGCDLAQGYGIAKPMPASEINIWLINHTAIKEWKISANNTYSEKERIKKLIRLTSDHWFNNFKEKWKSHDSDKTSLIIDRTKCHQCFWIKRKKHAHSFEQHWLDNIAQLHEQTHILTEHMINERLSGKPDIANKKFKELQAIFNKINAALSQQT